MRNLQNLDPKLFDPAVPPRLKDLQLWFGSIIDRKIDANSRMNPISPRGVSMKIEAAEYITPSPTLQPAQRIELYCQQYWWRLLSCLHEMFPLVTRLFGHYDFNEIIAMPYLEAHPPKDWVLNDLGNKLPEWLEKNYHKKDRILVVDSARIDLAYNDAFVAGELPPIELATLPVPDDISSILDKKLVPQPHVYLFTFHGDMIRFRNEFLKQEPEYWAEHDFPYLNKKKLYYFVLYRNHHLNTVTKEVSQHEFQILKYLQQGRSIDDVCEWLENQDEKLVNVVSEKLSLWVQGWIVSRWFSIS